MGCGMSNPDDLKLYLDQFADYLLQKHDFNIRSVVKTDGKHVEMIVQFQQSKYINESSPEFEQGKKMIENDLVNFDIEDKRNKYRKYIKFAIIAWDTDSGEILQ